MRLAEARIGNSTRLIARLLSGRSAQLTRFTARGLSASLEFSSIPLGSHQAGILARRLRNCIDNWARKPKKRALRALAKDRTGGRPRATQGPNLAQEHCGPPSASDRSHDFVLDLGCAHPPLQAGRGRRAQAWIGELLDSVLTREIKRIRIWRGPCECKWVRRGFGSLRPPKR